MNRNVGRGIIRYIQKSVYCVWQCGNYSDVDKTVILWETKPDRVG